MAATALTLEDCVFFHAIDLPMSGRQPGVWDLIGRFDDQDAEGLNELVTVFVAHEEGLGL